MNTTQQGNLKTHYKLANLFGTLLKRLCLSVVRPTCEEVRNNTLKQLFVFHFLKKIGYKAA